MNTIFLKQKDPVALVVFLIGCFLVVTVAFFIARGDLDAYTDFLMGSSFRVEPGTIQPTSFAPGTEPDRMTDPSEVRPVIDFPAETLGAIEEPVERTPVTEPVAPVQPVQPQAEEPAAAPPVQPPQPATPAVQPSGGEFFVQAGAFSQQGNADRMVESLRGFGFQGVVRAEGGVFKVQIPGYATREEAERVVQQLRNQGIESFAAR